MKTKEIRQDLYTQTEYAKIIGKSTARVNQMIKNGDLKTVKINGAILIKV
jgi:hypothetical protein